MRPVTRTKDERAVAPIVAEILLVAMSVTLAATVFYVANNLATQANVSSHPFVALGPVDLQNGSATLPVISVSHPVAAVDYKVNLEVGTMMGTPASLAASGTPATVAVGGRSYEVVWQDVAGEGFLNGGDLLTVSAANGHLPNGVYSFFLIWNDGSVVQSAAWTV